MIYAILKSGKVQFNPVFTLGQDAWFTTENHQALHINNGQYHDPRIFNL